ncbi:MFS transporter, SP family, arabinose:H+ symporter [Pseudohyphozyma bogoriensis]|nr:MFS transporter, SP family, arabinose:H+ symporter [Pseudohyphozyma bogoriensis]
MSTSSLAQKQAKANGTSQYIENSLAQGGLVDESLVFVEGEDKVNPYTLSLSSVLLFGWDTAVISGALSNVGSALDGKVLTDTQHEWAVASLSVGAIFGAFFGGSYSDTIGRKPVLIVADVCFILGAVLLCASFSYIQFVVGRVVMGFGVGIATVTCAVYIGELAPTKVRGRLVAIQSVMITGGQLLAYAVAAGLDTVHNGWRILFAIGIPFALVQAVAMHFLPESPRYDVVAGRQERAIRTLTQIYRTATPEQVELKLKVIQLSADISNSLKVAHPSFVQRFHILVSTPKYLRCVTAATGLFIFQQLCGWNTLLYYSSTLFGAAGFNNVSTSLAPFPDVKLTAHRESSHLQSASWLPESTLCMDPVGRRKIFLLGVPTMTIAFVIASVAFYKMTQPTGGELITGADYDKTWVGLMLGMMVLFIIGYAPSLGTLPYTSIELIPLEIRGMGSAIAVTFTWAANVLISATYLTLINSIGPAGNYGLYGGICFLAVIFIYFTYPETAGLTLEETATLFDDGFGVRKAAQLRKTHKEIEKESSTAIKGRTAIVTGASTGNGRGIAVALAAAGADVVCVDLSPTQPKGVEEGEPTTHDLLVKQYGVKSIFVKGDVTSEATWQEVADAALALTGRIDILVNNAGILGKVGPIHEASLAQFQAVMNVNVNSVFLGVRAVIPTMLKQEAREGSVRGTIITIASNAAHHGAPGKAPYTASKGALVAFNKTLAVDYGRQGIKCVTVSPGVIHTALAAAEIANPNSLPNYRSQTPWPRFGRVDEVGSAVLWLASDLSDYCNGTDLVMDAGYVVA